MKKCKKEFVKNDEKPFKISHFPIAFCAFFLYNVGDYCGEVVALAEVIGIVSGKGGMGKTALTAALAVALAADGKKVLCVDCDDGRGDLDTYLGFGQLPDLTYPEVCCGGYPLEQAAIHPKFPKLRFLAAPLGENRTTPEEFAALLRQAKQNFDYILLDDPKFRGWVDRWVLIVRPDPAAIRGGRRMADQLELQGKGNVRLIVNAIDIKKMVSLAINVDDVMDQVGLPLLGIVPDDWNFTAACAAGSNLQTVTQKGAAAAAERIARRIQGIQTAIPSRL